MTNENIRAILAQRVRLEDRLRKLGAEWPEPWPWIEGDPVIRNLQLLEAVEEREAELRKELR